MNCIAECAESPPKQGSQIIVPGSVLALQDVAIQRLSPLRGLTAVFEMGTGVSPPPWPPELMRLAVAHATSVLAIAAT